MRAVTHASYKTGVHSWEEGLIEFLQPCPLKASSQYDARACVTLRRLRIDARCNTEQRKDRSILVFLCVALLRLNRHEKITKF